MKLSDSTLDILVRDFADSVVAKALIRAESGGDPLATNTYNNTPPSTDRGLWQINSYWHPEVSDEVAFDPLFATDEAFRISKGGTNFNAWSAYKQGTYKKKAVGMKSRLGIYVINTGDLPTEWFRCQPVVAVSMDHNPDYWKRVREISPATRIMGRFYLTESEQIFGNPYTDAESFFARCLPEMEKMRGLYDSWMSYNEPQVWDSDGAQRLSDFHLRWGDLMKKAGFKSGAYSFSEGHPDLSLWPVLAVGLRHCDYLVLHEYDAPEMWRTKGWRCLRYRKVREALPADLKEKPVFIGETGIDGGVAGVDKPQRGFREFGDGNHYMESFKWYDSELAKDKLVLGAAVFAAKWNIGNGSFDVADLKELPQYIGAEQSFQEPFETVLWAEAKKYPWMAVNNTAALWKAAKYMGLQDQQTDEFEFTYDGVTYLGQVFNKGILYVKKGDWGNVGVVRK